MSPELFRQTREALQLNGLSDKTQSAYLRAVRLLLDLHACAPEQLTEAQLRTYYFHARNVDRWSPSALRITAVLSVATVRALRAAVSEPDYGHMADPCAFCA